MINYILLILAFFFSALCGFISIPLILNFCKEKRLYDIPNSRKIHHNAVPRLGGISFFPSMFLAFTATIFAFSDYTDSEKITLSTWTLSFFVSLMLIYSVGIIDDLIGLGAKTKFAVQIIAASLMPAACLVLNNFYGFLGIYEVPFYIGAPLTVFVIVFIVNAINLIDGIDGLAAGISLIALGGFLVSFVSEEVWLYGILISGLMGILVPFLYFNLWGDPEKNRKIFMGDSGSLSLGFILAFLAVKFSMDNPNVMFWRPDCLLLSYTFLIVPVFDVVRVSMVRIFHHTPIFRADKNHIHHKLMRAGMSQHQTLLCILGLAIMFIAMNLILNGILSSTIIVFIDIVVWTIFHLLIDVVIRKNGNNVFIVSKDNE